MRKGKGSYTYGAVAFFLAAVFIGDFLNAVGKPFSLLPGDIREACIGAVLVLVLCSVASGSGKKGKDLPRVLHAWIINIVSLVAATFLLGDKPIGLARYGPVVPFQPLVLKTILFWIAVASYGRLLSIAQSLVLIQQKKHTRRNFLLLELFIGLCALAALPFWRESVFAGYWPAYGVWGHVFLAGMFGFLVQNGIRTRWIHYLNKRQKITTFLWGLFLIPFAVLLLMRLPPLLSAFSPVAGAFAVCMGWLCTIGSAMALLAILAHLPSAGLLDKRMKEIRSLQELSSAMGSIFDHERLLPRIAELALQVVEADAAWLELKSENRYEPVAFHRIGREVILKIPESIRESIRERAFSVNQPLLLNAVERDAAVKGIRTVYPAAGSLLAVPVRCQEAPEGLLVALKREPFGFEEESASLFQAFADQAALALENARLVRLTLEQERYKQELLVAHEAQIRLLPKRMPEVSGVELDGFSLTANDIGGDFYDAFSVRTDRIDLVVGDVSGNGARAAFTMAELHGAIRTLAFHFASPAEIVCQINAFLKGHDDPDTFATLLYALYQPSKRRIRMVRAGHQPVGYLFAKGVKWFEPKGMGLGLAPSVKLSESLEEKTLDLKPGEALFFYTDGLTDCRNASGDAFGETRLSKELETVRNESAEGILQGIRDSVERFMGDEFHDDDMTALVLRVKPKRQHLDV